MYLKRATPQNIVIGGAAGAAPPILGWTSIAGVQGIEICAVAFFDSVYLDAPSFLGAGDS